MNKYQLISSFLRRKHPVKQLETRYNVWLASAKLIYHCKVIPTQSYHILIILSPNNLFPTSESSHPKASRVCLALSCTPADTTVLWLTKMNAH